MISSHFIRKSLLSMSLCVIVNCSYTHAQSTKEQFQPEIYQDGKDVVWVPTPSELVEKMLDLAEVTKEDYVIDLGSGDGRTVIAAAKRGARALGIEYNPKMVELSKQNAKDEGVSQRAKFIETDLFEYDFSEATVITMFLLTDINIRLRPQILNLKPGTRIVSNTFTMGEWNPDDTGTVKSSDSGYNTALLWIVPAKVEGIWKLQQGKLTLEQNFQMISGALEIENTAIPIENGRLRGDHISFSVTTDQYTGMVNGNTIEGIVKSETNNREWKAIRDSN